MIQASENRIRALIRLLSDENERVARTVSGELVAMGDAALPLLQEAEIEQPEMACRIEAVLDEIRGSRLEEELRALTACPEERMDLERGVFLIARYAYPGLDPDPYARTLDDMATEARERMGSRVSGKEAVKTLNRYLFTEQGFRGNTKSYYEVENSYLNRVIDRRLGIPISLSVLYLLVGKRLGLPVAGVGMPGHFLVRFHSDRYKVFVDCFNAGALLSERDCTRFLTQAGYGFEDRYLQRSSVRTILSRCLKNLVAIYNKLEDPVKVTRFNRFIRVLEPDQDRGCKEDA